jgi:hypothetical protein
MSTATLGRLGFGVTALTILLGRGGAARTPEGWLLGLASAGTLLVVVVAVGGLAIRYPERGRIGLGLLPVLGLVLLGAPWPGDAALTGGPLVALGLAALCVGLTGEARGWSDRLFLPVVGVVYLIAAGQVQGQVGPEGDEPHYLMVAESLIRDHDLDLTRDYAEGRYRAFHSGHLDPHYRVRGRHGEIYSLHALGLSLLVLPAYALGGYAAASFFMAGLGIALAATVRRLLHDVLEHGAAEGTAWVVALSPPLLSFSGLIFTEVPAALGTTAALLLGRRAETLRPASLVGLGAILAFLPWLNVRYVVLSILLAAFVLAQRPGLRRAMLVAAPLALSAGGLALFHNALYGFIDPRRVYGRRPDFALATLREGLPGLLLDQEFGLLAHAPVFVLALAGAAILWRRDRRLLVVGVALVVVVFGTAGTWHMWRGGFNPPARFLVPIVPVLALGVGAAVARGFSAPAALLVGFGLWISSVGIAEPGLLHRDRDGTAPLWRVASGAQEWTTLLPGFVLADAGRRGLTGVWGVALLLSVPWRGPAGARGLVATSLGLLAATGAAATVSRGKTGGRDAVRVIGRPALSVPGFTPMGAAPARWGPGDLSWGPLYEPHRFPGGAAVGERLRLPPGAYRLELRARLLHEDAGSPRLGLQDRGREVGTGGEPGPAFERTATGLTVEFRLAQAQSDLTLLLRGGGALLLEGIELRVQPFPPPPV